MTANVEIVTGEHKDVVVVPNEALRFQPRGPAQAAPARDGWSTGAILTRSGDRAARLLERLKDQLELGEEELGKIGAALEAEFAAIKNAGPDGACWPQEVRLGLADGSVTEVTEGLAEGAQVVVRVREAAQ